MRRRRGTRRRHHAAARGGAAEQIARLRNGSREGRWGERAEQHKPAPGRRRASEHERRRQCLSWRRVQGQSSRMRGPRTRRTWSNQGEQTACLGICVTTLQHEASGTLFPLRHIGVAWPHGARDGDAGGARRSFRRRTRSCRLPAAAPPSSQRGPCDAYGAASAMVRRAKRGGARRGASCTC